MTGSRKTNWAGGRHSPVGVGVLIDQINLNLEFDQPVGQRIHLIDLDLVMRKLLDQLGETVDRPKSGSQNPQQHKDAAVQLLD